MSTLHTKGNYLSTDRCLISSILTATSRGLNLYSHRYRASRLFRLLWGSKHRLSDILFGRRDIVVAFAVRRRRRSHARTSRSWFGRAHFPLCASARLTVERGRSPRGEEGKRELIYNRRRRRRRRRWLPQPQYCRACALMALRHCGGGGRFHDM